MLTRRHESVRAFQECARLQALQAVAALLSVMKRLPEVHMLELGSGAAASAARDLGSALHPFLDHSLGGRLQPLCRAPFSWGAQLLESLQHMAQVGTRVTHAVDTPGKRCGRFRDRVLLNSWWMFPALCMGLKLGGKVAGTWSKKCSQEVMVEMQCLCC